MLMKIDPQMLAFHSSTVVQQPCTVKRSHTHALADWVHKANYHLAYQNTRNTP